MSTFVIRLAPWNSLSKKYTHEYDKINKHSQTFAKYQGHFIQYNNTPTRLSHYRFYFFSMPRLCLPVCVFACLCVCLTIGRSLRSYLQNWLTQIVFFNRQQSINRNIVWTEYGNLIFSLLFISSIYIALSIECIGAQPIKFLQFLSSRD